MTADGQPESSKSGSKTAAGARSGGGAGSGRRPNAGAGGNKKNSNRKNRGPPQRRTQVIAKSTRTKVSRTSVKIDLRAKKTEPLDLRSKTADAPESKTVAKAGAARNQSMGQRQRATRGGKRLPTRGQRQVQQPIPEPGLTIGAAEMIIMAMLQEIEEENSKENSKVLKRSETNQTVDTEVADEPERSLRSLDSTDSVATLSGASNSQLSSTFLMQAACLLVG